jgi:hypothetical protein
MSFRPRDRILANLESVYREAYERARSANDAQRMADLDASYQREQLILEVLLDIRDTIGTTEDRESSKTALEKLEALRRLTRLR